MPYTGASRSRRNLKPRNTDETRLSRSRATRDAGSDLLVPWVVSDDYPVRLE